MERKEDEDLKCLNVDVEFLERESDEELYCLTVDVELLEKDKELLFLIVREVEFWGIEAGKDLGWYAHKR